MTTTYSSTFTMHEQFRAYLYMIARLGIDDRFLAKIDLSGVVQETLLEAMQRWGDAENRTEAEQLAWLRRILRNNLIDQVRRFTTEARDIEKEISLDESSAMLTALIDRERQTPSKEFSLQEDLLQLAAALEKLPEDYRIAVEMRHLKGMSLHDTAERLGRTTQATAMVVFRALQQLRVLMGAE